MATTRPASVRSTACCGSQPVRELAEPLSSSALRKAWLTNGVPPPAQASQSDALISARVAKGRASEADKAALLGRIKATGDYADLKGCDLVVEAVFEDFGVKQEVLGRLDRLLIPDAMIATNTSSISVTRLAAATGRPERFIGLHFMNPVPVMKLVEVVRTIMTDDQTFDTAVAFAESVGKTVVRAKDTCGFASICSSLGVSGSDAK